MVAQFLPLLCLALQAAGGSQRQLVLDGVLQLRETFLVSGANLADLLLLQSHIFIK